MQILNTTRGTTIAKCASYAETFSSRLVGLLKRNSLGADEALVITSCNAIHMFFMKFSIDVIFVGKENRVVGLVKGIKPFHLSPIFWKATYAIEVSVGTIKESQTQLGDAVILKD